MLISGGFIIKGNYCFHRQVNSVRSITGFCCWYTVCIENMDIVRYVKMWFLSLSPAFFYQEGNWIVYPSFPSGMICWHFRMNSTHSSSKNHFGWLWFIHINWTLQRFFSLWPASQNPCMKLHHTKKQSDQSE